MTDWEVAVRTETNYIKKVRVNDCISRSDAEEAALGMTGAKEICYSTIKSYEDNIESNSYIESVENNYYEDSDDNDEYEKLDEMEIEMYDLMCQIAMEKGEELPTIEEFYDYLNG